MYRKAQNLVEIGLLLCLLVIVSTSVWTIYNHQKTKLAALSKSSITTSAVNLNSKNYNPNDVVKFNPTETAGSSALTLLTPALTSDQFNAYMSRITYGELKVALDGGDSQKGLADLANELISALGLPYKELSPDNVDMSTLTTLTGVLNTVADPKFSGNKDTAGEYVAQLNALLNSVCAAMPKTN